MTTELEKPAGAASGDGIDAHRTDALRVEQPVGGGEDSF